MLIATSTFKSEGESLKNLKVLNLKGGHTSPNSKTNQKVKLCDKFNPSKNEMKA